MSPPRRLDTRSRRCYLRGPRAEVPLAHRPLSTALVTGAAGYIGSTLVQRLLRQGVQVVGLDDLSRGHADALPPHVPLVRCDVRDPDGVAAALRSLGKVPDAVFHLAGLILVGESVHRPELYLSVNAGGTQVVVDACVEAGVPALVLASSAAVLSAEQGGAEKLDEDAAIAPESPYGLSKWQAEQTLAAAVSTGRIAGAAMRFFNVTGAADGCAERHDPESHLIPLAIRAAWGELPELQVFGCDFATPDGTCLRDYVHVADVTAALIAAAEQAIAQVAAGEPQLQVFHVGSGRGHSVFEVLHEVERAIDLPVPHRVVGRRDGDIAALVAEPSRMRALLGVRPSTDLPAMVRDCAEALRRHRP